MTLRIAIATTDGIYINQHFGHCQRWTIAEAEDDGSYRFMEQRNPVVLDQVHNEEAFAAIVGLLSDCTAILTERVGPRVDAELQRAGLSVFSYPGRIDTAIPKLIKYFKSQKREV